MDNRKGSVLIIALIMVAFLGALGVAVMNPSSTSQMLTDKRYCYTRAKIAADAAAERVKAIMCQDITPKPTADDGTSQCAKDVMGTEWNPVSYESNGNKDTAGVTFPEITMKASDGTPLFDTSVADSNFPQMTSLEGGEVKYIVYTVDSGNGNAASYVSAEFGEEVVNIKISYNRDLSTTEVHPSYFHAAYAANEYQDPNNPLYTFKVEQQVETYTDSWGNTTTHTYTDTINGKIFIDGDISFTNTPAINGDIKATGTITGNASGSNTELPGEDDIPPPNLSREGEWYQSLGMSDDGLSSTNPDVVTDLTDNPDGIPDGQIAGIICPYEDTGETQSYIANNPDATSGTQYMLDSNFFQEAGSSDPTYDSGSDSVIITVPAEYNNKAVYVPGDLWIDILNPTHIEFRTQNGDPVNLTFIVEGNVYMTDGINTGEFPEHSTKNPGNRDGLGIISVIAITNETGEGGTINYGDPSEGGGQIDPIKAFLYAEKDFKWNPKAENQGTFNINGNMTAGGIIDFTDRDSTDFVPITLQYDNSIESEDVRDNLPCLPKGSGRTVIPGSKFNQNSIQYL